MLLTLASCGDSDGPEVTGVPLPEYEAIANDPAANEPSPVDFGTSGQPTVVLFVEDGCAGCPEASDAISKAPDDLATIVTDRADAVADALGVTTRPFWVFIGADGEIVGRFGGELPLDRLQIIFDDLAT